MSYIKFTVHLELINQAISVRNPPAEVILKVIRSSLSKLCSKSNYVFYMTMK